MGAHLGRFRSEFGHLVTRAGQSHSAHQVRSAADRDLRPLQGRASGHRSRRLGRIGQGPGAGVTPAGWGRSPHRTGPGRSATGLEPGPGSHQEVVGGHSLAPGPGQTADHRTSWVCWFSLCPACRPCSCRTPIVAGGVYLVFAGGTVAIALGVGFILVGAIVTICAGVLGGATSSVVGVALSRLVVDDRALERFTATDPAGGARPGTACQL